MQDINDTLTPEQTQAVSLTGKICCLIAGPGSGKTHLLTARILRDTNTIAKPKDMVVVTFTNAAAKEIRERIDRWGGDSTQYRHIGTLHAWAMGNLRKAGDDRKIATQSQISDLSARMKKALGSMARNMSGSEVWRHAVDPPPYGNARTVGMAMRSLMRSNDLTHHDMVLADYLEQLRAAPQPPPAAVYVDEYQDSAPTDAAIYYALWAQKASLYLIGDPRQAIYGFRGTSPEWLIEAYRSANSTAQLTVNHRSGPKICRLATCIAYRMTGGWNHPTSQFDPTVRPANPDRHDDVSRRQFQSEAEEALAIVKWAEEFDATTATMAVLTRYNATATAIAGTLRKHGFPVQCSADADDREHGVDQRDAIERLQAWGCVPPQDIVDPWDWWRSAMIHLGIPMALQDAILPRLATVATRDDLIGLRDPVERMDGRKIAVATIHGAKGLEWDSVWLAQSDHLAIPENSEGGRLAFVAATRARAELTISHSTGRTEPESGRTRTGLTVSQWLV